MAALYLLVRVAGQLVAMPAEDVASVIEVDAIAPVPRTAPHVAGLFALRSRVLTVIDSCAALGLPAMPRDGLLTAVIVEAEGHSYALLVEAVEDVVTLGTPAACSAVLGPAWLPVARGQLAWDGQTLLLVDAKRLALGPELHAAAA